MAEMVTAEPPSSTSAAAAWHMFHIVFGARNPVWFEKHFFVEKTSQDSPKGIYDV